MSGTACPYCRQANVNDNSRWSLLTSISAKGLSMARTFLELRGEEDFNWRRLGEALVNEDALPVPNEYDRKCPFCRRGYVTVNSGESLWVDVGARVLGLVRTYFELCGDDRGARLSWRHLASVFVEGEEAASDAIYYNRVEVVHPSEKIHEDEFKDARDSTGSGWLGGHTR